MGITQYLPPDMIFTWVQSPGGKDQNSNKLFAARNILLANVFFYNQTNGQKKAPVWEKTVQALRMKYEFLLGKLVQSTKKNVPDAKYI